MIRRLSLALAGSLLLAGALAACATSAGTNGGAGAPASSASSVDDDNTDLDGDLEIDAAWLAGGTMVAVVTWGSSSCVPTATDASLEGGVLRVTLAEVPADTACTRDFVARGTPVTLPEGIDPAGDLEIAVTWSDATGDTELEGVAGLTTVEDGLPSAGWTDEDGTFALLTWGSSGCRPVIQDAAVSAPGEIAVTFVEPAPDRICTADFAPRVTMVAVSGVSDDTAYEAVLQGDGFAGDRVAIAGES